MLHEPIALDIDVDFLVIPRVTYGEYDERGSLPWIWPPELIARIQAASVLAPIVTIAHSVEGGYTPLQWKYLGDELACRLADPHTDASLWTALREGSIAEDRGAIELAAEHFRNAVRHAPGNAAPHFRLARISPDLGEARAAHRRAIELDPSYQTPFNSDGIWLCSTGRLEAAEREHRRTLELNSHDAFAQLGLGRIAAERKEWITAETWFRDALSMDPRLIDAWRGLGAALYETGRFAESITACERSIQLALSGVRSISSPPFTHMDHPRIWDTEMSLAFEQLARMYAAQGDAERSARAYRMSQAGVQRSSEESTRIGA